MAKTFKQSGVLIWFLDENLQKSAEYLTNVSLCKTIDGCFSALVTSILYYSGIRSKKIYQYAFNPDRKLDTLDRFFPEWPFRKPPQLKYFSNRTVKWVRHCREHFNYVKSYFDTLLCEYEYRFSRRHKLRALSEWIDSDMRTKIPYGNISKIVLPWKALNLKFRRRDIISGYRLQYQNDFLWGDPIAAYASSNRDVPDFVIKAFHLDTASMIT